MATDETPPDPVDVAAQAVTALLVSLSRNPIGSPTQAFVSAIRRQGHDVYDTSGLEGLRQVLARIRADAPSENVAALRVGVALKAWEGIAEEPLI